MTDEKIHYKEIDFGFEFGAATIERLFSDKKKKWIMVMVKTPKQELQIYVTKTGKVRVFDKDNVEWFPGNKEKK